MDHPSHEVEIPMPLNSNAYLAQSHENNTHSNEEMTHHHNSIVKKSPLLVKYRECLKNHAASIGGNATDGCGEFMPSGEEGTLEALKCSACNCHRNFHRKEIEGEIPNSSFDYFSHFKREKKYIGTSHHHNGVLIPRPTPHNMIMPLTMQQSESDEMEGYPRAPFAKKRHRTKFSSEQKEKMLAFAERAGWKLQKQEESVVQQLCQEIGVKRRVLKVWMHNNKHNYAKKTLDHEGTDNHTAITDSRGKNMEHNSIRITLFLLLIGSPFSTSDSPIKTVVVLVMENRSFDHMLGWMKSLNPSINGVNGSETNPVSTSDPNSPLINFKDGAHYVDPDPGHSFQAIREQIFGSNDTTADPAPMNGFAQQAKSMDPNMTDAVMNGFQPDKVAVYKELVSQFAVFDRWFASVPASTQPNRLYVHSGTSHGAMSNNPELLAKGYPQRTIFENLDDAGYSFGIYYQNVPAVLFYRNLRKLKYITKFHSYDFEFKKHCQKGSLPNYAVIEQRYMDSKSKPATDDHPSHDVYHGQMFIKEVYETLRASPQWNQTLLIITYDEHGGFYDHVPTPKNVPSPDGIIGPDPYYFTFDRLGVRVPTIMVSPWIEKGTVVHGPNGVPTPNSEYEHSSIPATVKKIFNLQAPFLTKRDAWAGTFEGIVKTRTEPRTDCPVQLPTPVQLRQTEANEEAKLTEFQQELMQLASVLNGDHQLLNFFEKFIQKMNVREGIAYMENAVKRFFEAGYSAKRMDVDEEQIVKMRPSLTSRIKASVQP